MNVLLKIVDALCFLGGGFALYTFGHDFLGAAVASLAVTPWRDMVRLVGSLIGLCLVRWAAIGLARWNDELHGPPGALMDPDAAWRRWLWS